MKCSFSTSNNVDNATRRYIIEISDAALTDNPLPKEQYITVGCGQRTFLQDRTDETVGALLAKLAWVASSIEHAASMSRQIKT